MDFFPSFSGFKDKLNKKQNQIVYTKFSADLDTPVSLMLKLTKNEKNSFLLESVTGGEIKGRYSREILMKGCSLDIHPSVFQTGCSAQIALALSNIISPPSVWVYF